MTPQELFAESRLAEAIELQESLVAQEPANPAARLFLIELLAFGGQLDAALSHLVLIESDDASWPASARSYRRLLTAERRRSHRLRRPEIIPDPVPPHARARWRAIRLLREGDPLMVVRWIDRADSLAPEVEGFLDGREFTGFRDADDRFGSVLEAFIQGQYVWLPWESVRRVKLEPARFLLDRLFRPAHVRLKNGAECDVHLPLIYPGSHKEEGVFALGQETDYVDWRQGPVLCIGGKLLLVEDDEVPLAECQMIELR